MLRNRLSTIHARFAIIKTRYKPVRGDFFIDDQDGDGRKDLFSYYSNDAQTQVYLHNIFKAATSVYDNISEGELTMKGTRITFNGHVDGNLDIYICDLAGRTVMNIHRQTSYIEAGSELDLSSEVGGLPPGLYIVVTLSNGCTTYRSPLLRY